MSKELTQAQINYYARQKMYAKVQLTADGWMKRSGKQDPEMTLWKSYALLMTDRGSERAEAMRSLQSISALADTKLAASLALVAAHKQSTVVDKEAVNHLEADVRAEVKTCGETALYLGALFLWLSGRSDKARDLVDKLCKMNRQSVNGLALRGWIDVTSGRDAHVKKSLKYLDEAVRLAGGGAQEIDALFGKAHFLFLEGQLDGALDSFNGAIAMFPQYVPGLIEKAKVHLAMSNWEDAVETCHRCLELEPNCVDARRMMMMNHLCRVGSVLDASAAITDLIQAIDAVEPSNHELFYSCSLVATRLSGRHALVLRQTRALLDRAIDIAPKNPDYICERGYHLVLNGEDQEAIQAYRKAMSLDETSVKALNGIILCQLNGDQLDEASQQLDFLNEIQSSIGRTAELSYLSALLASKRQRQANDIFAILDGPMKEHVDGLMTKPISEEFFIQLCPDLMLQVVSLYLQHGPTDPPSAGDAPAPVLEKCAHVLEAVTKGAPGLLAAVFMLARVKFLSGDTDAAKSGAQYCLNQDNTHADAHLLMARIHVSQGNFKAAGQSLEIGLSYNFEVREYPMYHMIQAKIQQSEGHKNTAVKTLAKVMKLPGVRRKLGPGAASKVKRPVTLAERVTVYLQLAEAFVICGQQHEAAKVMEDAMGEFAGTPEELRIQIANADLALGRGDIDAALAILNEITPAHSYFVQAKEKIAKIYLDHRKDKKLYVACYKELVDTNPSGHTYLLLGDAYMTVHDPYSAFQVYQEAFKESGFTNGVLASKCGTALVKTHDYDKAVRYYVTAAKTQVWLKADLAELYLKLNAFDRCEATLNEALDHPPSNDLHTLQSDVRYNILLARMHKRADRQSTAIERLNQAHSIQTDVLKRVTTERPDSLQQQKELAADICIQIAELAKDTMQEQQAISSYEEAKTLDTSSSKAVLSLAELYLSYGKLDDAHEQLSELLNKDKTNSEALLMMADVKFRMNENDAAIFHFEQLLDKEPEHYEALARVIDLLRRAGKLDSTEKYLKQAKKKSAKPDTEPGLNYCRGLYHRWLCEANLALKYFNLARKDSDFGIRALYHMIEIYVNPEDETLGGETFQDETRDTADDSSRQESAEGLLEELRQLGQAGSKKFRILECTVLTMPPNQNKASINKALEGFQEIMMEDANYVPALLGLAQAFMYGGKVNKARHQLKTIEKMRWQYEYAEEFEAALLLLADVYIKQSGKADMAQTPLKKVVAHNKSSYKAYEFMGYIMENERAYVNAADFYEFAWRYSQMMNLRIGYKLAFNYLKAGKNVEAIEISHQVLKVNPDYPGIKKDVIDKARANLRIGD